MAGEDGVRFFRIAYSHLELCQEPSMTVLCEWCPLGLC